MHRQGRPEGRAVLQLRSSTGANQPMQAEKRRAALCKADLGYNQYVEPQVAKGEACAVQAADRAQERQTGLHCQQKTAEAKAASSMGCSEEGYTRHISRVNIAHKPRRGDAGQYYSSRDAARGFRRREPDGQPALLREGRRQGCHVAHTKGHRVGKAIRQAGAGLSGETGG